MIDDIHWICKSDSPSFTTTFSALLDLDITDQRLMTIVVLRIIHTTQKDDSYLLTNHKNIGTRMYHEKQEHVLDEKNSMASAIIRKKLKIYNTYLMLIVDCKYTFPHVVN